MCLKTNIEINMGYKNLNDLLTNLTEVNNHFAKEKGTVSYHTFDFH